MRRGAVHRTSPDAGADPTPAPITGAAPDVVVTDAVDVAAAADEAVLVTLAGLARSATGPVPAGAVDEARELATHGDVFDALGRGESYHSSFVRKGIRCENFGC